MSDFTRSYNWGESLRLECALAGGLKGVHERIETIMGPALGSRPTFSKLFTQPEPPPHDTDPKDFVRAFVLLLALGQIPSEWGIDAALLPSFYDEKTLSDLGISSTGWLTQAA